MAKSFTDTIQAASGQTSQVDEQEQQALANASAGIMTPVGGAGEGLNQDQTKMLGTPAQKDSSLTAALRYGIQEDMDLQAVQRREDWVRKAERQPGQQDRDVTDWAGIADISNTVQRKTDEAIRAKLEEAASTMNTDAVNTALSDNWETSSQYMDPDSQYSQYKEDYDAAQEEYQALVERANNGEYIHWKTWSKASGKIGRIGLNMNKEWKKDDKYRRGLFDSVWSDLQAGKQPEAVQMTAVKAMLGVETDQEVMEHLSINLDEIELAKQVTAGDLDDPELMGEIATTLGKTPEEIAGMSIRELQDSIDGVKAEEFDTGAELQRAINDPALGGADRALFQQAAEDYGAISGEQAEMEFDELMKSVEGAETIEFGGEPFTIEEIFDDEKFTSVIAEYMQADDETRAEMAEREGFEEFAQFMDNHSEVLTQMTANITAAVEEGEEMAAEGQGAMMSADGTTEIPDHVFEDFLGYVPDPADIGDQAWMQKMESSSVYRMYRDPDQFAKDVGVDRAAVDKFMGLMPALREVDPNFMKQMANMSEAELLKYIKPDENGASVMDKTISTQEDINQLSSMAVETPEEQEAFFSNLGGGSENLQSLISSYRAAERMGHATDPETARFLQMVDRDGDGQLDDAKDVRERIDGMGDTPFSQRLRDHGGRGLKLDIEGATKKLAGLDQPLLSALSDGVITKDEIPALAERGAEGLNTILQQYGKDLDKEAKAEIHSVIQTGHRTEIAGQLAALTAIPAFKGYSLDSVNKMFDLGKEWRDASNGGKWMGNTSAENYQTMRKNLQPFLLVDDATLIGLPKKTQQFIKEMKDLAAKDRAMFEQTRRAYHHSEPGPPGSDPREREGWVKGWEVWDTSKSPPRLIGLQSDPDVVGAWQEGVLNGTIPISDRRMLGQ
ncbi:MAG: hypothetical protein GTO54_00060 [Nitrososphaeria archaeon]|nr:hypothetical protein [Nitrososphaeria archaeon]